MKISLALATDAKLHSVAALLREVRACTQRFIDVLWMNPGRLDKETMNRVPRGSLSYRHHSNCLKVALETISSTREAAKALGRKAGKPKIKGALCLSSLVAKIEKGKGSFDYVLKISGLVPNESIVVPFRGHKQLNYWLNKPGAKLLQGCILGDKWAALWIKLPNEKPKDGKILAIDTGIKKLLVDSNNQRYGTEMQQVMARISRCKPGSKGMLRARRARTNYINKAVKDLPWDDLSTLGIEDLTNIKHGKKKGRGKKFRKMIAPWTVRQVHKRIEEVAETNRVRLVKVDPRNTSRTCPSCRTVAKESRRGEEFQCIRPNCNYHADADYVGALEIFARTLGRFGQPMVARSTKPVT